MLLQNLVNSTKNVLDDKILDKYKKSMAEQLKCGQLILRHTFIIAAGAIMADMITPNFSRAEMSCRCGCGLDHMDEKFMKMLQQLLNELGPLPVTLGVRCDRHNHESGGYPKSAHLQSKGADIKIFGLRALQLVEEVRRIGFSGIGISQKGDKSSRFIHLDILT